MSTGRDSLGLSALSPAPVGSSLAVVEFSLVNYVAAASAMSAGVTCMTSSSLRSPKAGSR